MIMRTRSLLSLLSALALAASAHAAPAETNGLQQILNRACLEGTCAEGYRVTFKQINFEPNKQQVSLNLLLQPNPGIDYPVLTDAFEAQLVQNSYAAICKIKHVTGMEMMTDGESMKSDFKVILKTCLSALTERTEQALGRN